MNIEEAKEILEIIARQRPVIDPYHWDEALKLGIEALKGIQKVRKTLRPYVEALLPGETE